MAVVLSEIVEDRVQRDGRRYITERHLDDEGSEYLVTYLAEAGEDATAILPTRAAQIEEQILAEKNRPPEEPTFRLSEVEAAFTKATEKGEVDLVKLKEELAKIETGEVKIDAQIAVEVK